MSRFFFNKKGLNSIDFFVRCLGQGERVKLSEIWGVVSVVLVMFFCFMNICSVYVQQCVNVSVQPMSRELRAYASQNSTDASICAPIITSAMAAAMSTKTFLRYKTHSGSYSNVYATFFNFIFLPPGQYEENAMLLPRFKKQNRQVFSCPPCLGFGKTPGYDCVFGKRVPDVEMFLQEQNEAIRAEGALQRIRF